MPNQEAYTKALGDLLPKGDAWEAKDIPDSNLYQLLYTLAAGLYKVEGYAERLGAEMFPQSMNESIDEWESEYGLPDLCVTTGSSWQQRISSLISRFSSIGGQSPQYYIDVAKTLGFDITIDEFRPSRFGYSEFGDSYGETESWFTWRINILGIEVNYARFGDGFGALFRDIDNLSAIEILQCVMHWLKPAHTELIFLIEEN